MYQTCTIRNFEPDENLFIILDGWIKKYNTSPKSLLEKSKEVASLSIEWNVKSKKLLEREGFLEELKSWAAVNHQIVILTSVAISIFSVSTLALNSLLVSLRDAKTGDISYLLSNTDELQSANVSEEIAPGVYYVDENNRIVNEYGDTRAFIAEGDINTKGETSFSIPGNSWMENLITKGTLNQMLDGIMKAKNANTFEGANLPETSLENSNEDVESSVEVYNSEAPIASEEVVIQPTVNANGGLEITIPSSVRQTGLCPNYTSYSYFYGRWSRGTNQRALSEQWGSAGMPSANGIATLNGRYLVAVSPKFGRVGDNIDIVLTDGQIIPAIIADSKGADATSEWGHVMTQSGAVDIIEWEASGAKSDINLGTWRNVKVDKIVNYGSAPIQEVVPATEEVVPQLEEIIPDFEDEEVAVSSQVEGTEVEALDDQLNFELYNSTYGITGEEDVEVDQSESVAQKVYTLN